jgi:hypothetical protein
VNRGVARKRPLRDDGFRFPSDTAPLDAAQRFLMLALATVGVAQGALLLVDGRGITRIVAVALAIASFRIRLQYLEILAGLIVVNFAVHLAGLAPPFPDRLAHVSILAAYAAFGAASLATLVLKRTLGLQRSLAPALVVCCSTGVALIAFEAVAPRVAPIPAPGEVRWIGRVQPHPVLGDVYPPYGVLRAVYPDNPRGLFDQSGPSPWTVDVNDPGSEAVLDVSPDRPGVLRVQIVRADGPAPSSIQLNGPGISVKAGEPYALSFRARAEGARQITYGLGTAKTPSTGLGFSRQVAIGLEWQDFSDTFTLASEDASARVYFGVGGNPASIEVEHPVLRQMPSGIAVKPAATPPAAQVEYSLTLQFNAYGCRGDDYPIPRPANHRRILTLGGAETLGAGVPVWQTFAAQLERSLNEAQEDPAREPYDVINCGVKGYATRQERQFYELIGSRYEPNVVLLTMTERDNMSARDRERLGYVHQINKYEQLLLTAHLFQLARHEWRAPAVDYSSSLDDVVKLAEACRARGARLAVVAFRTSPLAPPWSTLVTAVAAKLNGTDIPFLDLGPALLTDHTPGDLKVHRIDPSPNEEAHRIAATEIEAFLKRHTLVR